MSWTCVKDVQKNVDSEACSEKPSNSRTDENIADMHVAVQKDCPITVCELSEDVKISYDSVQSILTDLGMRYVLAKFVAKLHSVDKKIRFQLYKISFALLRKITF